MDESSRLAERFEEHRTRLRAVAYRMLGSVAEADDAVQEAWLRLSRSQHDEIQNLGAWLTTVVARVSLNMLRSRSGGTRSRSACTFRTRSSTAPTPLDPEHEALLADSVGLALLVVLETLTPAERLAFVLHDMFALPFEEIAPIVDRSPEPPGSSPAARAAASGAQRAPPDADLARQREVVDAFLAAARDGDFDGPSACSTRTSCCAPTSAPTGLRCSYVGGGGVNMAARRGDAAAPQRPSTARWERSWPSMDGDSRSWRSPSPTTRSSIDDIAHPNESPDSPPPYSGSTHDPLAHVRRAAAPTRVHGQARNYP